MTEHVAHFRISGADFTRIARERLLEDAPGHAWRIASSLGNDDPNNREKGVADAALGILNGTKKLIGDERDMRIVKERTTVTAKHMAKVRETYAGRIRIRDKWYRPIAYVTNCGPHDMKNDHGIPVVRLGNNKGYSGRAWHYANRDEIVAEYAGYSDPDVPAIKREVIFRACGERPHWMDVPRDAQAALDEFLANGHRLEERSHTKWYDADEWYGDKDVGLTMGPTRANDLNAERAERERKALKNGDLTPMNARLNAELDLARELDEDDRPEIQALRDDPQRGEVLARAREVGPGVGVMAEMLDEFDPQALAKIKPETTYEIEAERLRREAHLVQGIENAADREDAEDQIDAERAALRLRRLADLRAAVLKQAGDDLLDLTWDAVMNHDGTEIRVPAGTAKVPRAPFLHWAFARMKMFEDQLPPWQTICPPGMKMMNDDPYHTDWVVGAGLDPDDRSLLYHPGPVADAAMKLSHELQDKFDEPSPVHVLVDGPCVSGTIHHGKRKKPCPAGAIVVLPNLHPDFLIAIDDAAGVITEEGGAVAHLAQIGRERNLPIVRIAGAIEKYNEGIVVMIDTASRQVRGF
jgi:phosphohistidine swiveling domain-containing protein